MKRLLSLITIFLSAVLLTGCLPPTSPLGDIVEPAPPKTYTPSSIDSTGATDVSAAFAAFLASVPNGGTIELARNGKYRMEKTLFVDNRKDLTFSGRNATFFSTTRGDRVRANIRVRGGENIVFRDIRVIGANPDAGKDGTFVLELEAQHAFDALGVKGFSLVNVFASDLYGDFVHLSHYAGKWTDGVIIRNSRFTRSGRQAVALVAVRNVVIENNLFTSMRRATFDFEPGGAIAGVDNVTIRNNDIGGGRLNFIAAAGDGPVNNVTIENNVLTNQALQVFMIDKLGGRRSNWKVVGNTSNMTINNPHKAAMRFWNVDGLEVRGNTQAFTANRGMYGSIVDNSCKLALDGNNFPGGSQALVTGTCPR